MKKPTLSNRFVENGFKLLEPYTLDAPIEASRTTTLDKFMNACTHHFQTICVSGRCKTEVCELCGTIYGACD